MALTTAFLNSAREAISVLPELTTFRSARVAAGTGTRADRIAAWHAAYSPTLTSPSPAYLLSQAIRNTINALADASGALGVLDRSAAFTTLNAEYVTVASKPQSDADELAALENLLALEHLS